MKMAFVMLAILILLSGCSEYQLYSSTKSASVEKIAPNTFQVNFCGNAYMSQDEVEKYALQRAAEVTLDKGFSYFSVVDRQDNSQSCMLTPGRTNMPTPRVEASAEGKMYTSYDFQPFAKPNVTLTIECYAKDKAMRKDAIEAKGFLNKNFPGLRK